MTMRLIARREPGAPHVFLPACVASARGVSTTQQVRAAHTCTILSRRAAKLSGSSRSDASDIPDVGRLADIPPLAPALRARVPAACQVHCQRSTSRHELDADFNPDFAGTSAEVTRGADVGGRLAGKGGPDRRAAPPRAQADGCR